MGGSRNNYLYGSGGDDELIGGNDNDTIEGGTGEDLLVGGAGENVFRFEVLNETTTTALEFYERAHISDFEDGVDKVLLVGVTAADVLIQQSDDGDAEIVVTGVDGNLTIELDGVNSSLIDTIDDFVYI